MEVGIMGLAASGKSTVFGLLTGQAATSTRRDAAQIGIARVPDPRLGALTTMYEPEKTTPATVRYVDVPGIPEKHRQVEATFNLPELRSADALMVVVRAFADESVAHPMGSVDPIRDLRHIEEEFILQDQLVVERRLERIRKDLAKRKVPELERECLILERCLEVLESERPLRAEDFSADELKQLRGFTFLSLKPILVVVNVSDDDIAGDPFTAETWAQWRDRPGMAFTRVCATLEHELSQLDSTEIAPFMEEYGITDRAIDRVIRESYRLLGSISFFTVGEDECRAWSVSTDTPAVEAGGVIHSDIERGFIRAEVVTYEDLIEVGHWDNCRNKGKMRLEGKEYLVKDGDAIVFRFNV